ncbi:hypothetical protein DB347_20255 [Opitutaceae bacterium EW11]|nr:hypothetical protein DB347_20255 [Opitutaceae bacterium EW11]
MSTKPISPVGPAPLGSLARKSASSGGLGYSFLGSFFLKYSNGEQPKLVDQVKYLLRILLHPVISYQWITCLSEPGTRDLWALRPRLATKLQRPYLAKTLGARRRKEALVNHYHLIRALISYERLVEIYGKGHVLLSIYSREHDRRWDLRLGYFNELEKEGELTISLVDTQTALRIANLTFCLYVENQSTVAMVGGLQSTRHENTRHAIRDTSKLMFGLRPKATVLWMLREILNAWGVQQLKAVSDKTHIYQHWRKRKQLDFKYDEFWAEAGGVIGADGLWILPLQEGKRSREDLKPNRRKTHELRYAFLGRLREVSHEAIERLRPNLGQRAALSGTILSIELSEPSQSVPL